ncbi:hypothetical protein NYR60_05575 [Actinobacillus genomosp. 2]|uniref:hypothetical protein n=1 Tax=Actinobacillus genomosp. 2 TaxID=230709 RepID=UPI002442C256|nr:hypothetical protein [Actinobacillus genomosp. 2]WGE31343.1 hypothetical protein NYR60_05575 [Actinobacillus genomosp. 2]
MKLKHLLSAVILACSTLLSGCFSLLTASEARVSTSHHESKVVAEDNITQFGLVKSTKQLVMMGDKYWYLLDQGSSNYVQKLIDAKLPKGFSTSGAVFQIKDKQAQTWEGETLLEYRTDKKAEKQKLNTLGFEGCYDCPEATYFFKRLSFSGKFFAKTEGIAVKSNLKTKLIIKFIEYKTEERVDGDGLTAIALMPFAIAADIVTLPLQLLIFATVDSGDIFHSP